MKIAITGAAGFVGRNLVEYLQQRYDNILPITRTELDLTHADAVRQYFVNNKVDIIIHCAAVGGSRKTGYDQHNDGVVDANTRMFFNLERCLTPEMRMIHIGSGAEFAREHWHAKMPEEYFDYHVPTDAYGYAKYIISKYIAHCSNITCLRIFGLFGRYEDYRFKFISNAIVKNILQLPIMINQNVVFDYLYIDDFLAIVEKMLFKNPSFRHYNITPTGSIDLVSIANKINAVGRFKSEITVLHEGMNREYTGDNSRLLAEIGDYSFVGYEEAIERLFSYYSAHLHELDLQTVQNDPYLQHCLVKN